MRSVSTIKTSPPSKPLLVAGAGAGAGADRDAKENGRASHYAPDSIGLSVGAPKGRGVGASGIRDKEEVGDSRLFVGVEHMPLVGDILENLFKKLAIEVKRADRKDLHGKKDTFFKNCVLLKEQKYDHLSVKNCSIILHRITKILISLGHVENNVSESVDDLCTRLNAQLAHTNPQNISNTLWALAKLVELGILSKINSLYINNFLEHFNRQCTLALPQNISITLWSLAKLVESGLLPKVDKKCVDNLVEQFNSKRAGAKLQGISNTLWAVAKLIELGILSEVNSLYLNNLIVQFNTRITRGTLQDVCNTIWSCGIINTLTTVTISAPLKELAELALQKTELHNVSPCMKRQVIMGIGLLRLKLEPRHEAKYERLIDECRPHSRLTSEQINPYVSDYEHKIEPNIHGFYVDAFIPEEKLIIEFDGKHHDMPKQKKFDLFRDDFLTRLGYTVIRVPTDESKLESKQASPTEKRKSTERSERSERSETDGSRFKKSRFFSPSGSGKEEAPWHEELRPTMFLSIAIGVKASLFQPAAAAEPVPVEAKRAVAGPTPS